MTFGNSSHKSLIGEAGFPAEPTLSIPTLLTGALRVTRCIYYKARIFSWANMLSVKAFMFILYSRGVKLVGFWGPHFIYEQSYRGPHEVLGLEITTSLGNDLCNVARSKVDLQKKNHHLSIISEVICNNFTKTA